MTSPARSPLVLLQSSDWHAGSPLTGTGLRLQQELRDARRAEVDAAAERAVTAAREAEADGLLLPGDLWDAESVPPSTIHRLLEAFASASPLPVFIAPGNHDFAGHAGWYDPSVLRALGMRSWPENVVVFREPEWTTVPFPGRDDVTVTGRAFLSSAVTEGRPLVPPPRPEGRTALLLLHGSYEGYSGFDAPAGAKRTAPFSREELLATGFTWTALGHHHHVQVVTDGAGVPRAAYSGCPTGRGLDETGPRVFLKVTLRGKDVVVETLPADTRTVRDLALDTAGLDGAALLERAAAILDAERAAPADLVRLTLTGIQSHGARPAAALAPLASRVAHLTVRDRTEPPAADEPAGLRTAEGRFVADLTARRDRAPDERSRRVAALALSLGRDALAGRALRPPDADEP